MLIGTRGSKLALKQVDIVIGLLNKKFPEAEFEKKIIKTTGDKILDAPLAKIGGKGLFVKEIDEAVSKGEVHFAVHSMKDVPVELPHDLELVCVPEREEVSDALISNGLSIDELSRNAVIGTSSIRRKAELLNYRNDFIMRELRGNIDTRLRKLRAGEYDAIVMAKAGLKRLGFEGIITQELPLDIFLPSVGQGAIAIVARKDFEQKSMLAAINHAASMQCCTAERALLLGLGGGCQVPVGVITEVGKKLKIKVAVLSPDGKKRIQVEMEGKPAETEKLGSAVADKLLENGADIILLV